MAVTEPKRPRWRCTVPGCPMGRWQTLRMWQGDPLDAAVTALQRHHTQDHSKENAN